MRKVILAKLTAQESELIQAKERNYNTFKTLLQNQFISSEEKQAIAHEVNKLASDAKLFYSNLSQKYGIPYVANLNYRVSPETNELFIEVFG